MPRRLPIRQGRDEDRRHHVHHRNCAASTPGRSHDDVVANLQKKNERQAEQITSLNGHQKRNKDELDKAKAKANADDQEIRKLRRQLAEQAAEADAHAEMQDALISFGTGAVHDQLVRAEKAEKEIARLQSVVSGLENSVSSLQVQVVHFEQAMNASADDFTRLCMEAQAQRSVRMVRGYQDDMTRQMETIETLKSEIAAYDGAWKVWKTFEQQDAERLRELEHIKPQLAASKQRAESVQDIANEQSALIARLNEENARLVGGGWIP